MAYQQTAATRETRERKRQALLDGTRGLLVEGGFAAVSVQSVASRAQVSTGSVYTYFPDKASLLVAAFHRSAEPELRAVQDAARALPDDAPGRVASFRLARAVDTFARRAMRGRTLARALLLEPVDPAVDAVRLEYRRAYADAFAGIVADGVAAGELPDQDVGLAATALVGAIGEALTGPLSPLTADDDEAGRDRVVADILTFCRRGVGVTASPGGDR